MTGLGFGIVTVFGFGFRLCVEFISMADLGLEEELHLRWADYFKQDAHLKLV